MKYIDKVKVDDAVTIGRLRMVAEVITGAGRITGHDVNNGTIGFEVESEPNETAFDFGVRMADLRDELAAWRCEIEPSARKVNGLDA